MLERIENISRNKQYRGKRHSNNFNNYFNKSSASVNIGKDSISFSPAALYLATLKYTIREIEYPSGDVIGFDFFIDEFEIETKINLAEFFIQPRQVFYLSRSIMGNNSSYKTTIKLNVNKLIVKSLLNNDEAEAKVFRELFDRIKELKINSNFDINDSSVVNLLKDGYEERLFSNFSTIINNLYTFIYKHEKFQVPNQFKFKGNDYGLISIEEISRIYT